MGEKEKGEQHKGSMTTAEAGHLGGKEVQHQRHMRDTKQVRGQAYDKPGPAKGTAYGIAAITQALEGIDFPVTKRDLLKRVGDRQIEYRKDQPISLRKVISDLEAEEFPSMANIVEGVSDALKEEGISGSKAAPKKRDSA